MVSARRTCSFGSPVVRTTGRRLSPSPSCSTSPCSAPRETRRLRGRSTPCWIAGASAGSSPGSGSLTTKLQHVRADLVGASAEAERAVAGELRPLRPVLLSDALQPARRAPAVLPDWVRRSLRSHVFARRALDPAHVKARAGPVFGDCPGRGRQELKGSGI